MEIMEHDKVVVGYYDSVIGCYDKLAEYYKDEIKEFLAYDEDYYGVISNIIDLLKKLENGLENGVIDKDDLVIVNFITSPKGEWFEAYKLGEVCKLDRKEELK